MVTRIRVGVVFGGKSGEHEVSIESAKSVIEALDRNKYDVMPIAIDKQGRWSAGERARRVLEGGWATLQAPRTNGNVVTEGNTGDDVFAGSVPEQGLQTGQPSVIPEHVMESIDVLFPVLHGSYGEDGTVQGMFELLNVPYVGAGVAASSVGMDKVLMKRMFAAVGLPQVDYVYCTRNEWETDPSMVTKNVETRLGYPCFVKPANLGSSVGISKVKSQAELRNAIDLAAKYDRKIIIEQGLNVREVEVAVLGNDAPKASVPGEVIPSNEFYDYRAKYLDGESTLMIPAPISDELTEEIRRLAIQAYKAIDCSGLARVDFFVEKDTQRVLINEINTMPGFTKFSMYPKLWEATGVAYSELIGKLLAYAIERAEERRRSQIEFDV
ncbi:D-alanine--D-alanine ligase [Alicyclobacillus mengziensis]|uniref:D-alanine--D-alanine ligase n=1 Tax=Alicyclobacillus mengziensis TaxID=2931921 RepID=A0A9X7W435_9BACL|nr:D-alanine--D-alanine ligase [Alicyclobacillus mengziensis]QSO49980.1 D-alanine--D-alanine ligase [Alicyclobacillus mengziensis]